MLVNDGKTHGQGRPDHTNFFICFSLGKKWQFSATKIGPVDSDDGHIDDMATKTLTHPRIVVLFEYEKLNNASTKSYKTAIHPPLFPKRLPTHASMLKVEKPR